MVLGLLLTSCETASDITKNGNAIGVQISTFMRTADDAFPYAESWCNRYGKSTFLRGRANNYWHFGCK